MDLWLRTSTNAIHFVIYFKFRLLIAHFNTINELFKYWVNHVTVLNYYKNRNYIIAMNNAAKHFTLEIQKDLYDGVLNKDNVIRQKKKN